MSSKISSTNEPILEVSKLSIGYDKKPILKDLSFKAFKGEILFVMGGNGSGKSTLLKTLSNLIPPLSGSITIRGKKVNDFSPVNFAKELSVLLTERPSLGSMKVKEVLSLGRFPYTSFWGSMKLEDKSIINDVVDLLKIKNLINKTYDTLSDGQKQKVLLGRTLAQDTPIIILDEPTSFLDIPRKIEFLENLKLLAKEKNKMIILSSHDWDLALKASHSLLFIGKNGISKKGFPEDFYFKKDFKAFLEDEGFQVSDETSHNSIFQVGGLNIKLNIEDQFEKDLTLKALEKRKLLLGKENNSFIISKKKNHPFFIEGMNGPSLKINEISEIIEYLKGF
tara:strand:- start:140 stop:1150 length:1011 start_codon:yes stop_codon:yes gene_type:complete